MNLDPEIQKLIEKENRKWKEMSDKKLEADFNNAMAQIEKDFTERTEIINTHPIDELDDALEKHSVYSKLFDEAETMNINGTMPQKQVYGQKQERIDKLNSDEAYQQKKKNTPAVKTSEEILSDKNSVKVIDKLKAQGFTEKQAISLIAENGADDAMAVAKSVHRHKAKSNADIKYARRMPENFEKHMGLITSDMTLKEKIAMKHLEKKDLIDNARDSVAKARMAYDKPVPEKLKKQIIKEANPNSTIASVAKGNKWTIANGAFAGIMGIADYKESRKEGKTVLESAGSAVFEFAKGEVLGFWGSVGLDIVKGVPKMAVGAYNEVQSVNRSMNNLQRFTPFADSQFADTQQLATMRQSGMEMAKMANYNLQQTLMGTEAKYLHR